jgi:hypothetical protein
MLKAEILIMDLRSQDDSKQATLRIRLARNPQYIREK